MYLHILHSSLMWMNKYSIRKRRPLFLGRLFLIINSITKKGCINNAAFFCMLISFLFLQRSDAFFQCSNLAFGVGLFLAFHFNDIGWSLAHELFVAELLQYTLEETFVVLQVSFQLTTINILVGKLLFYYFLFLLLCIH